MARKLGVELGLDVTGYIEGTKQVQYATNKSEQSLKEYVEANGRLAKQLRAAKEEARNLAVQFNDLSAAEKSSEYGKAMAENLDFAINKAAELQDVMNDTNDAIKNRASDTATFDAIHQGFDAIGDSVLGVAGMIASATGKQEDFNRVMTAWVGIEKSLSAAIKIKNALQKNSSLMLAITNLQTKAAAQAELLLAANTGKATLAQRAFNLVAKANPYVLLISTLIAAGGAVLAFTRFINKSNKELDEHEKQIKETNKRWDEYKIKIGNATGSIVADYKVLQSQWKQLSTEHERAKWVKENQSKFKALGLSIKDVKAAEDAFYNNTSKVVEALKARAEAEAWGDVYREELKRVHQNDIHGTVENGRYYNRVKEGGDIYDLTAEERREFNVHTKSAYAGSQKITKELAYQVNLRRRNLALQKQEADRKPALEAEKKMNEAKKTQITKEKELGDLFDTTTESAVSGTRHVREEIEAAKGSIVDISNEISHLQELARKGKLPEELKDPTAFAKKIQELTDKRTKLEIQWGFKAAPTYKQELDNQLKDAQVQLDVAIKANDEQGIESAKDAIRGIQKSINDYNLKAKVEVEPVFTQQDIDKIYNAAQELVDSTNPKVDIWGDFSFLPDDKRKEAEELKDQYDAIVKAREEAFKKMNDADADDHTIAAYQRALEELGIRLEKIKPQLEGLNIENLNFEKAEKSAIKLSNALSLTADVMSSFGSIFNDLGKASKDKGLQTAGIIAQAIATLALSFAEVMRSTKHWTEWLAFGITGIATLVSMTTQIKQLSAGGYANGGVIPGSSYHGDNLLIHANSGERVLTAQQNRNFERLINGMDYSMFGPQRIVVTGKVVGGDIYLSQKHYKTINHIK